MGKKMSFRTKVTGPSDSCTPDKPKCDKAKFRIRKHKTEVKTIPSGGTHMNMNNLGGNPGDVRMQKKSGSDELNARQEAQGAANETKIGKEKKKLAFRKKLGL